MYLATADVFGGLVGGLLIGIASSALLFLTGKVSGISGISHTLVTARHEADLFGWRAAYFAGLLVAGAGLSILRPEAFGSESTLRPATALAAGLIIGFGSRLGSGCTSGHGVCGLPRLSPRSLVAVMTFMATGALTAAFVRQPSNRDLFYSPKTFTVPHPTGAPSSILIWAPTAAVLVSCYFLFQRNGWLRNALGAAPSTAKPGTTMHDSYAERTAALLCGLAFGVALGVSGMTNADRVQGFLDFGGDNGWDITLAFVMGGAVAFNLLSFPWLRKEGRKPLIGHGQQPIECILAVGTAKPNMLIDWKLIVGSALFGVGWGLAGVCPGPGIVSLGAGKSIAAIVVPSMLVGMAVYEVTMGAGFFHHKPHHHNSTTAHTSTTNGTSHGSNSNQPGASANKADGSHTVQRGSTIPSKSTAVTDGHHAHDAASNSEDEKGHGPSSSSSASGTGGARTSAAAVAGTGNGSAIEQFDH